MNKILIIEDDDVTRTLSKKVLEGAGLIASRVDGTKRPRRLVGAGIEAMDEWLAMVREAMERNYDRLDDVLAAMEIDKSKERKRDDDDKDDT